MVPCEWPLADFSCSSVVVSDCSIHSPSVAIRGPRDRSRPPRPRVSAAPVPPGPAQVGVARSRQQRPGPRSPLPPGNRPRRSELARSHRRELARGHRRELAKSHRSEVARDHRRELAIQFVPQILVNCRYQFELRRPPPQDSVSIILLTRLRRYTLNDRIKERPKKLFNKS